MSQPFTRVAAIDVNGAENAEGARRGNLVLEIQSRQGGMIDFDIDLDLLGQAITLQEGIDRRDVVIVLMFGGFEGLRLDEDGALEADLMLVFHHHGQEACVLIQLAGQIRVQQRVVTLASAPTAHSSHRPGDAWFPMHSAPEPRPTRTPRGRAVEAPPA